MSNLINVSKKRKLSRKAETIIAKRYSLKDSVGKPTEDWAGVCHRVANAVMKDSPNLSALETLMLETKFIPNTPCLVNAGKENGQLAACFVLDVPDSIDGIMEHARIAAKIHQSGGGTGMSYELIRPQGAAVNSTRGVASGPVSFMNIVNTTTEVVKQGGVRRGANMGIMSINHPDVLRFIHAKNDQHSLTNFNISVTVTDKFMEAVENKDWFHLEFDNKLWDKLIFDPVTGDDYKVYVPITNDSDNPELSELDYLRLAGTVTFVDQEMYLENKYNYERSYEAEGKYYQMMPPRPGMVYAPDVWNRIVASAHKFAEPGVIFIDRVNQHNYLMNSRGKIFSCNPCGEEFLHANNSCNLGSIDVSKFVGDDGAFDFDGFREAIFLAVEFLDNVVDVSVWTTPEIDSTVKATRPVGLGPMGIGDALIKSKLAYGSSESYLWIDKVLTFFRKEAWAASCELGKTKGVFPEYEVNRNLYEDFFLDLVGGCSCEGPNETYPNGYDCGNHNFTPRNYEVTTIAPTGTISQIAGCSSGIEPNFEFAYVREDTVSKNYYAHPLAAEYLGIEIEDSEEGIKNAGLEIINRRDELPAYFVAAMDISAEAHVRMLAAAQRHIDNSISKTCNGSADDTVESVDSLYQLAYQLGCKAVSYYRDGSRENQVLTTVKSSSKTSENKKVEDVEPVQTPKQSANVSRPERLNGCTIRFKVGADWEYLTVNKNSDGIIVEVFNGGGNVSSSVGLLISKMLQSGAFTVEDLARTLDKSKGEYSISIEGKIVTSPEQAFAQILRVEAGLVPSRQQKTAMVNQFQTSESVIKDVSASEMAFSKCPSCSKNTLLKISGCDSCQDCGWSRC